MTVFNTSLLKYVRGSVNNKFETRIYCVHYFRFQQVRLGKENTWKTQR